LKTIDLGRSEHRITSQNMFEDRESNNQYDAKEYYPTAQDVYGPNIDVTIQEDDTQPLEVPIVPRPAEKKFEACYGANWQPKYSADFLICLMTNSELNRNLALVGHFHHGKTTFINMLIEQTHFDRIESFYFNKKRTICGQPKR
jgi:U5 small nuclear ribonucleoprotein component